MVQTDASAYGYVIPLNIQRIYAEYAEFGTEYSLVLRYILLNRKTFTYFIYLFIMLLRDSLYLVGLLGFSSVHRLYSYQIDIFHHAFA